MPFKYVFNCGWRKKFKILKNGSDYQGAWPPLVYAISTIYWDNNTCNFALCPKTSKL